MANKSAISLQKGRKRVRMRTRLSMLILLVVIFQLITSVAVLVFGGEFRYLEEYSYNALKEKTESCSTYIQNELQRKSVYVQEYAKRIDAIVSEILEERGEDAADFQTDMELVYRALKSSADPVSGLLRTAAADEAYIILETGDLYGVDSGGIARASLYLKDEDTDPDMENSDLMMLFGFSSICNDFGFTRHSDWSMHLTIGKEGDPNFDFYFKTLQTAKENGNTAKNDLGYWSRFSKASSNIAPSMKYSVPLTLEDGTVYGVLGIGLTENTILTAIPSSDFSGDSACYVLGFCDSDTRYNILLRSGSAYRSLLGSADTLSIVENTRERIYSFKAVTDVDLTGSVQTFDLYDDNSPYRAEQWALILVADRSSVLRPIVFLKKMLWISALLSLLAAAIVAAIGCNMLIRPIANLSKMIKVKHNYNEVIRFKPSNIYEIDEITDAITQLQINVQGFSSQVSKMISIADVGLGTFMYDRTDDSVFVGASLIKVLRLALPQGEDIVMDRHDFLDSINNTEIRNLIAAGLGMNDGKMGEDINNVHKINQTGGGSLWLRLDYTYSANMAIGIVQDITDTMIEKNRIEHERDYDNLTGLLNRHAYYRQVEKMFHDKSKLNITAFVMVDLDNLKYVNDTYGHNFGDDYIKTAAAALKKFQDHGGIVSRLSGDEFSICLPGFSSKEEVRKIIADVRDELLKSSCLLADGTHFKVSGSMGVSWYPDDSESRELLMKYADFAMYTIKHSTKGAIAEFDWDSYSADSVLLTGVEEMNRIIENGSVRYAFQSIVSAKTGEVYGYEALMRVQSEIFRSPLELLRTAKTGAKLYEIERMTMIKSLEDFQKLIDSGRVEKTARIFINSIANNRLEPEVEASIEKKYSHLVDQIVIEILEGEILDEEYTAHKARLIQKWGGQIALDDFGTGYNSEYALLSLKPNIIKIDRSIIAGCDKDPDRRMIIENLVKLAQAKGILVLAEGVETEDEMKTAVLCGVDFLQGYYLAMPLFEPEPIDPKIADTIRSLAKGETK